MLIRVHVASWHVRWEQIVDEIAHLIPLSSNENDIYSVIGMPKEKYDPPDPRRMYTIMSSEEAANGKKSYWAELEISGKCIQTLAGCLCVFFFPIFSIITIVNCQLGNICIIHSSIHSWMNEHLYHIIHIYVSYHVLSIMG